MTPREQLQSLLEAAPAAEFIPVPRAWLRAVLEEDTPAPADQVLDMATAARLSDYSTEHLRRLVRSGRIANVGSRYRPRIRLADLPRKPGALRTIGPQAQDGSAGRALPRNRKEARP